MLLVYNSDLLDESVFHVSANDRAFQYGDGLFETIRYEAGRVWFWSDHIERLTAGMSALRLLAPSGFSTETLHQTVLNLLAANELTDQCARIKILVWRQAGGLYTPSTNQSNVLITTRSAQFSISHKPAAKIGIYDTIRVAYSPISAYKLINSLPYVLAGIHKQENGFDDVVLLDQAGHVAECLASNLFWLRHGQLHTPSLQTGCIDGVARRNLLRTFPDANEGLFYPDVLSGADFVFAANIMGIQVYRGELTEPLISQLLSLFTGNSPLPLPG